MTNFCPKCRKAVEEGTICSCQNDALTHSSEIAKGYINLFLETLRGLLKRPVDTISSYSSSKNFGFGITIIILQSLFVGLFLYGCIKQTVTALHLTTTLEFFVGYEVSFIKVVLLGFIYSAVSFALTIAMIYVIAGIILKTNVDIKKITACVGVSTIFTVITTLMAAILVHVSVSLSMILFLVGSLFYFVYLFQGLEEITTVGKNKLAYVYIPTLCTVALVIAYILPNILK